MALSMIETPRGPRGRYMRRLAVWIGLILFAALPSVRFAGAQALEPGGAVDMGSVSVGASSANDTVTFTATVNTTISSVTSVEEGAQSQDFVLVSQNCTGTIQAEHTCNITVNFTPKKIGLRRGAILIADNTGTVVNEQFFLGVGIGPQLVFSPVTSTMLSSVASLTPSTFKTSSAVYDGAGNLYFNDYLNGRILKLDTSNNVTSFASQVGNTHSALAINGVGLLYVTSTTQGKVSVINPSGVVSTLVIPGVTLTAPSGIAVDGGGFIYIADSQANQIVRVAPDSSVAAVVPMTGLATPLSSPYGLAVDHDILYIADSGNGRIVEVALSTGAVTALTPDNALNQPYGIGVDASGSLVVASAGDSTLEQVSATGTISAITGDAGVTTASSPLGAIVTSTGDIVASDATLGVVFLKRSSGELTFPTPTKEGSFDATDGFETLTVQNSGNQAIQFSATAPTISSSDFASGTTNTCPVLQSTSTPLAIAASCTYSFGFTPSVVGTDDATVNVRGTAVPSGYNITATSQLIGTGTTPIDTLQVIATPGATTPNTPVSFTVTAFQGTNIVTGFTGTVTFTMTDPTGTFLGGTSYTFKASDNGTHTFSAALGANFDVPGNYTISAHIGSIIGTSNIVVVLYNSSTALTSSVNPLQAGSQTTLTATVSPIATAITPTGTITFFDGTNIVGTCTLVAGKCNAPIALSAGSNQTLTAVYSGDTNFATSTSNVINETVNAYNAQVVETSNINPSSVAQQVTLTATVKAVPGQTGAPTPSGTITFMDGTATLGTGTLVSGVATLNFSFTTSGTHNLTAVYDGGAMYSPVTSAIYPQVVIGHFTAVATVTTATNPSNVGQSVQVSGTLQPTAGQTNAPALTGTVTFFDGTTKLGTAPVNGNYAGGGPITFTTAGNHNLTLVYSGDSNYASITSPIYVQVVNYTAVATVTTAINPSNVGQSVQVSGTLQPAAGQTNAPALTGTVTFFDGTTKLGTAPVNGNYAGGGPITFTTAGSHNLTLVYSGDSNYASVTSPIYVQVVNGTFTAVATVTTVTNPSNVNQSVQVNGTLKPTAGQTNAPALTGTVTFFDGTTKLGSSPVNGNYAGGGPITFTTAGNHNLTLVYSGDSNYASVTSPIYVQVVNNSFTAVATVTTAVNPSSVNQSVQVSGTLQPTAGQTNAPALTGTVTFFDGTTKLGTAPVNGNYAGGGPITFTTAGNHSLTLVYSGDTNYPAVTSPIYVQVVGANSTTAATLTSSINPSSINQQTTLTATITATPGQTGAGTPTGTVTFKDGATSLGTVTLVNGVATLPASFTTVGNHILTAVYNPTGNFSATTSLPLTQVVTSTFTASDILTSSVNPSNINQQTTLTATIAATPGQTGAGTPGGTVTFKDGTMALGTVTLVNGVATFPATFTTSGNHTLTALYSGDTNFGTVTSSPLTQVVNPFASHTGLTSSINPSAINQQTALTATVTPGSGSTTTPTGSVTFNNGATVLGSANLINGIAILPVSFSATGNDTLTAVYSGDTTYGTSTSNAVTQVVSTFAATVALTSSASPAFINNSVTFTATLTPNSATPPTGSVTFMNGTTPLGSATLVNGVATLPISFSTTGTDSITAVYNGDTNYATVTSPAFSEVIEDFTFTLATPTSGSATVAGGSPATYTFTLAPVGGTTLAGPIAFSLSGFPTGSIFSFSPASVATGTGTTTITLTITPPVVQALDRNRPVHPRSNGVAPIAFAFLALPLAFVFGKKRRRPAALFLWLMLFASALGLTGCLSDASSGYYGNDTPGTYSLNATASSGALSHTAGATLVRQ